MKDANPNLARIQKLREDRYKIRLTLQFLTLLKEFNKFDLELTKNLVEAVEKCLGFENKRE